METQTILTKPGDSAPKLNYGFAKRYHVLVGEIIEDHIHVYHTQMLSLELIQELRRSLKCKLKFETISADEFQKRLSEAYETGSDEAMQMAEVMGESLNLESLAEQLPTSEDLLDNHDDAPIIRLLNAVFSQAVKQQVSDIHIETYAKAMHIRFRIDGVLRDVLTLQRILAPLVISRIKVMAKLDIAEKRLPQDGRISLKIAGHTVDVRVSTLPSNHGERVVLRLLDQKAASLNLGALGMGKYNLDICEKTIKKPNGIILVTGPTGAGKSTTLYAMLMRLNEVTRNILTVEDPIEYDLPGIGQTQVNAKVDMTFARGLRAILRQDPDVVMVGEIRDLETAEIAIQASLTGHLVLSTLHTNTAIGAITRLRDMGVEPFLLASSLISVIAQRLVRVLCPACKISEAATPQEKELLNLKDDESCQLFHAQGCDACQMTGFKGRTGIYDVISIDETMAQMIHDNASEQHIERYARKIFPGMRADGLLRVKGGITTLSEVFSVTLEDHP